MYLLLGLLLLSPPVFSATAYEKFKMQHTYRNNNFVDCNRDLNPILQSLNMPCKPCNSFILGDQSFSTDMNAVNAVCGRGGIRESGNNFRSINTFRVVKCSQQATGRQPPNCDYRKVTQRSIQTTTILLSCVNNLPVHFNPC